MFCARQGLVGTLPTSKLPSETPHAAGRVRGPARLPAQLPARLPGGCSHSLRFTSPATRSAKDRGAACCSAALRKLGRPHLLQKSAPSMSYGEPQKGQAAGPCDCERPVCGVTLAAAAHKFGETPAVARAHSFQEIEVPVAGVPAVQADAGV